MTSTLDTYRGVKQLIDEYGEDAPIEAAARADRMLDTGDVDGQAVCKRIITAIEDLTSEMPTGTLH